MTGEGQAGDVVGWTLLEKDGAEKEKEFLKQKDSCLPFSFPDLSET